MLLKFVGKCSDMACHVWRFGDVMWTVYTQTWHATSLQASGNETVYTQTGPTIYIHLPANFAVFEIAHQLFSPLNSFFTIPNPFKKILENKSQLISKSYLEFKVIFTNLQFFLYICIKSCQVKISFNTKDKFIQPESFIWIKNCGRNGIYSHFSVRKKNRQICWLYQVLAVQSHNHRCRPLPPGWRVQA